MKGELLMKKILIVMFAAMCFAFPVTAHSFLTDADFSAGVFVGDSISATVRMDVSRNTAGVLNIGWGFGRGLYLRPQWQFTIDELQFQIQGLRFYPYVGAAVPVGLTAGIDAAVDVAAGISYFFFDIPMEIYTEILLGAKFVESGDLTFGPDYGGGIGARYALGR